ncbi:type 2 isopentenyl-diphosphate Delta-isomerase [Lactococcus fujiensis]|uniref:type 2 isopentenyl-diphosphate Delta-isomerase n=1 Tax=Lactococcus fujiensis TaxID=610251 RepID=UPI000BDF4516|nr:type 2 isopentenyl-diphosphate Delta-isomerase [Lactococcus fujiensis]
MVREKEIHQHRKDEHISLGLKNWRFKEQWPEFSGLKFSDVRLIPQGLPELALSEIDLSVQLFGYQFAFPFYIEAMTGGSTLGTSINEQLAEVAAQQSLALAVGSQSVAIKFPELAADYRKLRRINPNGFMFANLGAHHNLESAKKAVDMLEANALELHINVAQELTMKNSEGDRSFYWLENINEIANKLDVPVIVKEVGFGFSQEMYRQLAQTEIAAINIGGKGGTNFAWIEHERGGEFKLDDYGLTTVESLLEAEISGNRKDLIATGGIQDAQEIIKSQMLGAKLVSSAGFMLHTLRSETDGVQALNRNIEQWKEELRRFYLLQGARDLSQLQTRELLMSPNAQLFSDVRKKSQIDYLVKSK